VTNAMSRVLGKVYNISWELYLVVNVGRPNGFEKIVVSARAVITITRLKQMARNHFKKIII
jgi:hypothetical protein